MKKKRDIFFPLFIYVFRKPFCFKLLINIFSVCQT
nr:MAG TPA: Sterol methyltransferase C-terminal [Caudoviricetes sp.]